MNKTIKNTSTNNSSQSHLGIKNKTRFTKIMYYFVLSTLILSAVFIAFLLPNLSNISTDQWNRSKSDYILMLLQCLLGIVVIHIPDFFEKKLSFSISERMIRFYVVFLYCAIYLGEVRALYYRIPFWDTILHAISSMALASLGFSFISILNKTDSIPVNLSPVFVSFFALCFAITIGSIWEIYEFLADSVLGTNMQKYMLEDKTLLIGHAAISDTMKDIIVDSIGALISSTLGFLSLVYDKNKQKTVNQ